MPGPSDTLRVEPPDANTRGPGAGRAGGAARENREPGETDRRCDHCGADCGSHPVRQGPRQFCCHGCRTVYELLSQSGLGHFYDLGRHAGLRPAAGVPPTTWAYLDDPAVRDRLLDFNDGTTARVTFRIPAMHCIACVWLLENLFQLHPGIGRSQVNFPRREVSITFQLSALPLSGLVGLLASMGYTPVLTLGELDRPAADPERHRRALQIGVAGFAFGNIMLFSLPAYLGFDSFSGPLFQRVFGYLSLALALPVLLYSAGDYWRSAWVAVRQRMLTLEVPIALGLAALYAQSAYLIGSGRGEGYLDSLAGLVFFLLCGRAFQQKTHNRLAFDRDYRCFFPLSVVRKTATGEKTVALSQLAVGDRLVIRNGELVPADARLLAGPACMDYSFVTGEAEPVPRQVGDVLHAGGQQVGGALEIETLRPVSQSYLTSLWNHESFRKRRGDELDTLTNRYSRRFTLLVLGIALGAVAFWLAREDPGRAVRAFTSVLIVACPCALALAAPFALGTAQRLLERAGMHLQHAQVVERLARVDTIVLDKTGTLTSVQAQTVDFRGAPLSAAEAAGVRALTRQSVHPHSRRLGATLASAGAEPAVVGFREVPGRGLVGWVEGREIRLGSREWLREGGVTVPEETAGGPMGSRVWVALGGQGRGYFTLVHPLRPEAEGLMAWLRPRFELALLSGDNAQDQDRFSSLFGSDRCLFFNQTPLAKLGYIRARQQAGRTVMMVGDGLNDAGALRQSDVGVAVVEAIGVFSPASDVIVEASQVPQLSVLLNLARRTVRIIRVSFAISALYNAVGIAIAAAGWLSPVLCAVLMPLSSVSVVGFASGATARAARRCGLVASAPDATRPQPV